MKSCPACKRTYPNDAGFCPVEGTPLISASMVPVAMSDDARIGTKLAGRYEIRRVVADGGMGRVYEGIDKQTDSRIAVKVLHADVAKDDVSLERFKREYEMSAPTSRTTSSSASRTFSVTATLASGCSSWSTSRGRSCGSR